MSGFDRGPLERALAEQHRRWLEKRSQAIKVDQAPQDHRTLGQRLRGLRRLHKLTQHVAARAIKINNSQLSLIENDHVHPSREHLARMAEFYMVPVSYLLSGRLEEQG